MRRKIWNGLPDMLRHLMLAWFSAVTAAYLPLSGQQRSLEGIEGLQAMSFAQVFIVTLVLFGILCLVAYFVRIDISRAERYGLLIVFVILSVAALSVSFTVPFLAAVLLVDVILSVYALYGHSNQPSEMPIKSEKPAAAFWAVFGLALLFFLFVSMWTVFRVLTYASPSFDFGIFSQMFYHMRTTGLPNTTIERDGLLSHFKVHVSPIYYLMLPFYCLYPEPMILQILQAAVLVSAVVPAWKLARIHGCTPAAAVLFCQILLMYPAYSGGVGYDLHENAFLTPLLLWLFYAIDRRNGRAAVFTGILTLMVKEDAAVYVAVIALWLLLRSLFDNEDRRPWGIRMGSLLLAGALIWFVSVTGYLAVYGDGVMTNRYNNWIYDDSGSLLTVIKAAIVSPLKVLYESVDQEKLEFIALTMAPLCAMPFLTRKYERYILLIPYVLVNLMSDYTYQHDIFFQYTYGSTACLLYLMIINYADMMVKLRHAFMRYIPLLLAAAISAVSFAVTVVPVAVRYPARYLYQSTYYSNVGAMLKIIPDDASVTAATFYTVPLSNREILYDVRYSSKAHMLSTEYVVLEINNQSCYTRYATTDGNGYDNLIVLLEKNSYQLIASMEDTLVIYKKTIS